MSGALRFEVLDTPGHTPEHVSYRGGGRAGAGRPGAAAERRLDPGRRGRADRPAGADHAVPYAHDMYHSIHDTLLPLGDPVHVHPTHGAGSLCSTGIGDASSTTIGHERSFDPLLAPMDIDAFARALLAGQPAIPRYFARMRPLNQAGPPLLGGVVPTPPPMDPAAVEAAVAAGATVVDAPPAAAHAAGHIAGSISIPLEDSFGTWLGWVVDLDRPVVLIAARPEDLDPIMRQAIRIGRDEVAGYLAGGSRRGPRPGARSRRAAAVDRRAGGRAGGLQRRRRADGHRRPPDERVRGRPRPGRLAHQRRLAAGPSRGPAA